MAIWSMEEQTLEDFIEEDLPFLIQPDYEATVIVLEKKLRAAKLACGRSHNLSLDTVISNYPNFLTKVKYHLFFFFAHQMSELKLNNNNDFTILYQTIATTYREKYLDSFAEKQINEYLEKQNIRSSS
jgi:hypothetical protein